MNRLELIEELEIKLGYKFKDINLLKTALTHSSYTNESKSNLENYERYEFLGDAVLELAISEILFKNYPKKTEGELSKLRSNIVCEQTLYSVGKSLNIGETMYLGKGEIATGGEDRPSIIADVFESVLAAIFLDSDYETVKNIINIILKKYVLISVKGQIFDDYKSAIQEFLQSKSITNIKYNLISAIGPEHNKEFTSELVVNGISIAKGVGKSKKASEQEAARVAYKIVKVNFKGE
ncbi:MAG: ribonuclease III [Clostridiales bacterium]|nr:MAG: ribonuclease III [Clostridiales bacterium]